MAEGAPDERRHVLKVFNIVQQVDKEWCFVVRGGYPCVGVRGLLLHVGVGGRGSQEGQGRDGGARRALAEQFWSRTVSSGCDMTAPLLPDQILHAVVGESPSGSTAL